MKKKEKKVKARKTWTINPKTKIKKSGKRYKRPKKKKELKDLIKEFL